MERLNTHYALLIAFGLIYLGFAAYTFTWGDYPCLLLHQKQSGSICWSL